MAVAQEFAVSLNGVGYRIKLRWCAPAGCWIMNVADQNGGPIVSGIPLVTGSPLLAQFRYLDIGGDLIVQSDTDAYAVPTYDSLGKTGHIYFLPLPAAA